MKYTIIEGTVYDRVKEHAQKAEIGGMSNIRKDDRQQTLGVDQMVGQLGELALARYMGDEDYYFQRRDQINLTPRTGDGGRDWKTDVDVKTSLMRRSQDPLTYRLLVRPRELHVENTYILALTASVESPVKLWFVGWARASELERDTSGMFSGVYAMKASALRDMADF